jgi:hypothetical protein
MGGKRRLAKEAMTAAAERPMSVAIPRSIERGPVEACSVFTETTVMIGREPSILCRPSRRWRKSGHDRTATAASEHNAPVQSNSPREADPTF